MAFLLVVGAERRARYYVMTYASRGEDRTRAKRVEWPSHRRERVRRRTIACAALAVLAAATVHAQSTDFMELVKSAAPQAVQAAISRGADVKSRDLNGTTPLHAAAQYNHDPAVIAVLVKAGADLNAKDVNGCTPAVLALEGTELLDYAQGNKALQGTDAYRKLQEASQ